MDLNARADKKIVTTVPVVNVDATAQSDLWKRKLVLTIFCTLTLITFIAGYLSRGNETNQLRPIASASSCDPSQDVGGVLFFDSNTDGIENGALFDGTDGSLASSVGGGQVATTGNGIDGFAFEGVSFGNNKVNTPQAFWGPRTSYLSSNPNSSQKIQPTPDVPNVTVKLYDSTNTEIESVILNGQGEWSVENIASSLPLRAEYSGLPNDFSFTNSVDGTVGQRHFITSTGCEYNAGFVNPSEYCQTNPDVVFTCNFREGFDGATLQSIAYNSAEQLNDSDSDSDVDQDDSASENPDVTKAPSTPNSLAANSDTGPIFGLAYSRQSKQLFTSAVTSGSGGFLTGQTRIINSYGPAGAGGIYKVDTTSGSPAATLLYSVAGVSGGSTYPTSIGTTGLGGLEISSDGTKLYTVNLETKSLVTLTLSSAENSSPTVLSQEDVSIPDPGCSGNVSDTYRPYSVTTWHSNIYVGTVCTNQLKGFVQKYDGSAWSTFYTTDEAEIAKIGGQPVEGGIYTDLTLYAPFFITGLEFDTDGSIIIGTSAGAGHTDNAQGEIYLVPRESSSYGIANVFQPGGQDFFDNTGAIATLPGTGQIIASAQSPTTTMSNGLVWLNTSSFQVEKKYTPFRTVVSPYDGTLANSNAIGGIALICDSAPLYVSGRVWNDGELTSQDNNGIQDPQETGIAGVTVNLYDSSRTLIGSALTDSNGIWSFGGINEENGVQILSDTEYFTRIDNDSDFNSGGPLSTMTIVQSNASGSTSLSRSVASENNGFPEINFTTSSPGSQLINLDTGMQLPAPPIESTTTAVTTAPPATTTSSPSTSTTTTTSTTTSVVPTTTTEPETTTTLPVGSEPDVGETDEQPAVSGIVDEKIFEKGISGKAQSSDNSVEPVPEGNGKNSQKLSIAAVKHALFSAIPNSITRNVPTYFFLLLLISIAGFFFYKKRQHRKQAKEILASNDPLFERSDSHREAKD